MADKSYGRMPSSANANEPARLRDIGDFPASTSGQTPSPEQGYAEVVAFSDRLLGTQNQAVTGVTSTFTLTAPTVRANFYADGCDMCIRLGAGAQTALTTDAFIPNGKSIELSIDRTTQTDVGVIAVTGTGTLRVTRLA